MRKDSRIFVAGHNGLVGSAVVRQLKASGYQNLILKSRDALELRDQRAVRSFFAEEEPEYVVLAAAKVGGIHANNRYPADFIYDNLVIQNNIIHSSYAFGVKRMLFLGSSCIYPKEAPQPMAESCLLTGPLEPTNEPYALAKIAGIKLCESFNRQYGTCFVSAMPTNLYGPGDNFHIENSHVVPALIRKFHDAVKRGEAEVIIWGSGQPKREFMHVDDLARACLFVLELPMKEIKIKFLEPSEPSWINVGTGREVTIRKLAEMIGEISGYKGRLIFDSEKPDGTPRKLLDISRMNSLGWSAETDLYTGLSSTYQWFTDNTENFRK